jgi:hypothetical protein
LVIAVGEDVKLVEKETVSMYSGHHVTTKGTKSSLNKKIERTLSFDEDISAGNKLHLGGDDRKENSKSDGGIIMVGEDDAMNTNVTTKRLKL